MSKFIHEENLKLFRKRLDETTDLEKRQMLLKLLAEEEAKDEQPRLGQTPSGDRRPHQS
ncbi:MAG TPA: hypothetical protein VF396_11260 [Bradyrhizobium sp.]|jgi:hypothetical protein